MVIKASQDIWNHELRLNWIILSVFCFANICPFWFIYYHSPQYFKLQISRFFSALCHSVVEGYVACWNKPFLCNLPIGWNKGFSNVTSQLFCNQKQLFFQQHFASMVWPWSSQCELSSYLVGIVRPIYSEMTALTLF